MQIRTTPIGPDAGTSAVLVVAGTRPEIIKQAPLLRALRQADDFRPYLMSTGQHREMLRQMLDVFDLTVDFDLDLMRPGQSLDVIAAAVLAGTGSVIDRVRPRAVVVQGDTTSAMAAAMSAFHRRVPVVHLEAGLRTGDRYSPFPEEVNRRLISQLATLHLAPTEPARRNLEADGIDGSSITVTGNTVVDALHWVRDAGLPFRGPSAAQLATVAADRSARVLLVTAHRRESWERGLSGIARAVVTLVDRYPDLRVVLPLHRNAVVRAAFRPIVDGRERILVVDPLEYGSFVRLLQRADLILTDSGGIQEEGVALGKPTLVVRENTERGEALASGAARLVGTGPSRIVREVSRLLDDPSAYRAMAGLVSPFGDGRAAGRCVAALRGLVRSSSSGASTGASMSGASSSGAARAAGAPAGPGTPAGLTMAAD